MAEFILLGKTWVNLDKVYTVEMPDTQTGEWVCVVNSDKGSKEFKGEDAKQLVEFLKKRRVDAK
jgi:hypothetical protein